MIDPYDHSVDHSSEIEFRRERIQRKERWKPYGLTERGRETIRICGLERPSLLTLYEAHVQDRVRPKLATFLGVAEMAVPQDIVRAWRTLLRGLFSPYQQFHALSRDALRVLVWPELRARYQLAL